MLFYVVIYAERILSQRKQNMSVPTLTAFVFFL